MFCTSVKNDLGCRVPDCRHQRCVIDAGSLEYDQCVPCCCNSRLSPLMVRMGLRAVSPSTRADTGSSTSRPDRSPVEDVVHAIPGTSSCHHHSGRHGIPPSTGRFGSMHEIAGNLAAGMQRIGIQCGLAWTREARARRRRENAGLPGQGQTDQTVGGPTGVRRISTITGWSNIETGLAGVNYGPMSTDEEERLRASEQILQLSEDQIVGESVIDKLNRICLFSLQ